MAGFTYKNTNDLFLSKCKTPNIENLLAEKALVEKRLHEIDEQIAQDEKLTKCKLIYGNILFTRLLSLLSNGDVKELGNMACLQSFSGIGGTDGIGQPVPPVKDFTYRLLANYDISSNELIDISFIFAGEKLHMKIDDSGFLGRVLVYNDDGDELLMKHIESTEFKRDLYEFINSPL